MTELLFIVTESPGGGYSARAVGQPVFTQADTDGELERNVREAVLVHFADPEQRPRVLHLRFVRDRTIPLQPEAAGPADAFGDDGVNKDGVEIPVALRGDALHESSP